MDVKGAGWKSVHWIHLTIGNSGVNGVFWL